MNDRHDPRTGEIDDGPVVDGEVLEPISTGVLAVIQKAEIDGQVATAKAYPRNVTKLKQELTALVTMDEDTADDCIYALPRGNKHIKGPSARFADALISFWGNARSGAFITQVDKENKFVEAIGSFQDVERNVIRQRRVRRPIVTSRGQLYNTDMINMTGNAACVIAERNAILNGIPKSLWGPAYEQAFALVAGTTKTLSDKLDRATKAFALMGISMDQVLEKLGYSDITKVVPDDIVTMRGMLTALKTGEETVETIFGRGAGAHQHEKVENPLQDQPADGNVQRQTASSPNGSGTTAEQTESSGSVRDPITSGLPGKTETAASEGAKSDTVAKATETAADAGSKKPDADVQPTGNNAVPAAATKAEAEKPAPEYEQTADSYISFMRDCFDRATVKAAVTDKWGATRSDRTKLLSPEQIEELTKDKEAAIQRLKSKEKS